MNDEEFMRLAIKEAKKAASYGEAPIGAVVVRDGEVVGRGYNLRETGKNALAHAEIMAINEACVTLGGWRLPGCTLYVTLEPCPMCAGAVINSRVERVVFGAYDPKAGAAGSVTDLFGMKFNHKPETAGGVLADECGALLSDFFSRLRKTKNGEK